MSFNYRIGKKTLEYSVDLSNDIYEEDCYGVVEAYYNDNGEIVFTSEKIQLPYGETLEELKASFEDMQKAFELPVLDLDNIVYAKY